MIHGPYWSRLKCWNGGNSWVCPFKRTNLDASFFEWFKMDVDVLTTPANMINSRQADKFVSFGLVGNYHVVPASWRRSQTHSVLPHSEVVP